MLGAALEHVLWHWKRALADGALRPHEATLDLLWHRVKSCLHDAELAQRVRRRAERLMERDVLGAQKPYLDELHAFFEAAPAAVHGLTRLDLLFVDAVLRALTLCVVERMQTDLLDRAAAVHGLLAPHFAEKALRCVYHRTPSEWEEKRWQLLLLLRNESVCDAQVRQTISKEALRQEREQKRSQKQRAKRKEAPHDTGADKSVHKKLKSK